MGVVGWMGLVWDRGKAAGVWIGRGHVWGGGEGVERGGARVSVGVRGGFCGWE